MKKKALTLAIAAALSAPASFAATDSEGMQYTRASEGFYGRIATKIDSKSTKDGKAGISFDAVRIGVRGTNDMGGGLDGFYQWESGVSEGNGDSSFGGRLAHFGVRGAFGQVQVGSFWTADYNWVGANTDLVGVGSGNSGTYYDNDNDNDNDGIGARQARSSGASLEYQTPDLNGFQGAARLSTNRHSNSDSTVGLWNLAGKYDIQGFTVGASYNVVKDGYALGAYCPGGSSGVGPVLTDGTCAAANGTVVAATTEDRKTWSLGLAYAQDNWHVAGWYGTDNYSDGRGAIVTTGDNNAARNAPTKLEDSNTITLGGKVDLGKVAVFANWQRTDNYLGVKGNKRSYGGVGVGYTFTQQTGVNVSYRLQDFDDQKGSTNAMTGKSNAATNFLRLDMYHSF